MSSDHLLVIPDVICAPARHPRHGVAGLARSLSRRRGQPAPGSGPVRRAGRHRLLLRRQGPRPVYGYYAAVKDGNGGKRFALSEARKLLRLACRILTGLAGNALAAA